MAIFLFRRIESAIFLIFHAFSTAKTAIRFQNRYLTFIMRKKYDFTVDLTRLGPIEPRPQAIQGENRHLRVANLPTFEQV